MPKSRAARWLLFAALLIAATVVAYFLPLLDWIAIAQARIENYGMWSPVLYVVLYIVFTLALIPGSALTFTAGLLYGPIRGTAISLAASTIAAVLAFLVARYTLRERLTRKWAQSPQFQALDRAVARDAWKIVILMRLSPAFPYVLLNYAFGLTRVRLATFTICSLVGMVPATLLLTTAASALGEAAETAKRESAAAGSAAPAVLTSKGSADAESVRAGVAWLRNRQLVLWREDAADEQAEQARLAELARSLASRVRHGEALPPALPGESAEAARDRASKALGDAAREAREAARFLSEGRAGTARDRQKKAAEQFLTAKGEKKVVNWGLWTVIGASLLVTVAVGRLAQKALADASKAAPTAPSN